MCSPGTLTAGFRLFGNEEELRKDAIAHLYAVYVRMNNEMAATIGLSEQVRIAARDLENSTIPVYPLMTSVCWPLMAILYRVRLYCR